MKILEIYETPLPQPAPYSAIRAAFLNNSTLLKEIILHPNYKNSSVADRVAFISKAFSGQLSLADKLRFVITHLAIDISNPARRAAENTASNAIGNSVIAKPFVKTAHNWLQGLMSFEMEDVPDGLKNLCYRYQKSAEFVQKTNHRILAACSAIIQEQ